MQMDAGVDTGDMLMKSEVEIAPSDTYASLSDKLAQAGAQMIIPALAAIEKGESRRLPQDDSLSCHVGMIDKNMGKIDFSRSAEEIDRLIRGLNPWPSAYTSIREKRLKYGKPSLCRKVRTGNREAFKGQKRTPYISIREMASLR